MSSERVEQCLEDVRADLARQGGLSADDVHRLIAAHELTPVEMATVFTTLATERIVLDTDEPVGVDADSWSLPPALGQLLNHLKDRRLLTADEEVALGRRIDAGAAAQAELDANPEHVNRLEPLIADGLAAKEELVLANVRLVVNIAKRYQEQGLDLADLVQEGMFGLMRAAEKFDHRLGYKFSTYATWWIRQSLTRGVANQSRLIRLPVHFVEFLHLVVRTARVVESRLGRPPRLAELTGLLQEDPAKVQMALEYSRAPLSFDAPLGGSDITAEMFVPVVQSVESEVLEELQREHIARALTILEATLRSTKKGVSANGAQILARRAGLEGDGHVWTLDEIGRDYGVSRERIRQVQQKVLESEQVRELFHGLRPG